MKEWHVHVYTCLFEEEERIKLEDLAFYKYIHSCGNKHEFGTGFLVSKKLRQQVTDFKTIDDRTCIQRVRGRFQKYSLMSIHAPTEREKGHLLLLFGKSV